MQLTNPFPNSPDDVKVYGRIPRAIDDYFFRHVLAGFRGSDGNSGFRTTLINHFFRALHVACVAEGIKPVFDETNEQRIAELLARINFNATGDAAPRKRPAPRRANLPTPVASTQRTGGEHDGRPASRVRRVAAKASGKSADADGENPIGGKAK